MDPDLVQSDTYEFDEIYDMDLLLEEVARQLRIQTGEGSHAPILRCHMLQKETDQDRRGTPHFWLHHGAGRSPSGWQRIQFEPVHDGLHIPVGEAHGADELEEYWYQDMRVLPWIYSRHMLSEEPVSQMQMGVNPVPLSDSTTQCVNAEAPPLPSSKPLPPELEGIPPMPTRRPPRPS